MWPREGFVGGFYFFLWVGSVGDEDQLIHQRREMDGRRKQGNHRIMELFGLEKPPSQAHLSRWHRDTAPHSCRPFPAVWDGKALLSRSFLPQGEGKQRLQQRGLKSSFLPGRESPGLRLSVPSAALRGVCSPNDKTRFPPVPDSFPVPEPHSCPALAVPISHAG